MPSHVTLLSIFVVLSALMPSALSFAQSRPVQRQIGFESGDTFVISVQSTGRLARPWTNISHIISPILADGTAYNWTDWLDVREPGGYISTEPIGSDGFNAMVSAIENDGGTLGDSIRNPATNVAHGGGGFSGTIDCPGRCGVMTWQPHFLSWGGTFEPSGATGELSIPNVDDTDDGGRGRGSFLPMCVECGVGIQSFRAGGVMASAGYRHDMSWVLTGGFLGITLATVLP